MLPKMARSSLMVRNTNQLLHIHVIQDLNAKVRKLLAVQPKGIGAHSHLLATESVSIDLYGYSLLMTLTKCTEVVRFKVTYITESATKAQYSM